MPSIRDPSIHDVVSQLWEGEIEPQIRNYITIPALSPAFQPDWDEAGQIAAAVEQLSSWMGARPIEGLCVEVQDLSLPGSPAVTPLIVAEIQPFGSDGHGGPGRRGETGGGTEPTVVLYGHLDKQPEMLPWRDGLGPWTPVREGDRLYGRGGADDGYSAFASLAAIEAVQRSGGSHGHCFVLIEASEESGSPDLPAHVEALVERLGDVDLVVCLDSSCATYDTVWLTTSLRGLVDGTLTVEVLTEGVHSGSASGIVPSSFRIIRQLLDRVEDASSGRVLLAAANTEIPDHRRREAEALVEAISSPTGESLPLVDGMEAMNDQPVDNVLAKTWKPTVSYTGIDGIPTTTMAGNVLRPATALKLSLRLPPMADPEAVRDELRAVLLADPPYGATVRFDRSETASGWNSPELSPWLRAVLDDASNAVFGQPVQQLGEGGSIPFMAMLGDRFPAAQFVITGVLGPESNAHGPNEFLDVAYAEKLTAVIAHVLQGHARS